jgi:hypothetical protein
MPMPQAAGRRHPDLERADEVGVVVHRFLVAGFLVGGLRHEARGLVSRRRSSSENPLAYSRPVMKSSNRSVTDGSLSDARASGETSTRVGRR